jgi:hypothetical protein
MRKSPAPEEKIAKHLAQIVSDVNLDIEQVGIYLARNFPSVSYRRLQVVIESAEWEKEAKYDREHINPLFE